MESLNYDNYPVICDSGTGYDILNNLQIFKIRKRN